MYFKRVFGHLKIPLLLVNVFSHPVCDKKSRFYKIYSSYIFVSRIIRDFAIDDNVWNSP